MNADQTPEDGAVLNCVCGHALDLHTDESGCPEAPKRCRCQRGLPKRWAVKMICCGRDEGAATFDTPEEAHAFREAYTSGVGVDPHGYSGDGHSGHQRAGIVMHRPTYADLARDLREQRSRDGQS